MNYNLLKLSTLLCMCSSLSLSGIGLRPLSRIFPRYHGSNGNKLKKFNDEDLLDNHFKTDRPCYKEAREAWVRTMPTWEKGWRRMKQRGLTATLRDMGSLAYKDYQSIKKQINCAAQWVLSKFSSRDQ